MQNMKESTENKINTVVNSPLLTTQNKISALEELKRKVLSHKQNNELSGMLREEPEIPIHYIKEKYFKKSHLI